GVRVQASAGPTAIRLPDGTLVLVHQGGELGQRQAPEAVGTEVEVGHADVEEPGPGDGAVVSPLEFPWVPCGSCGMASMSAAPIAAESRATESSSGFEREGCRRRAARPGGAWATEPIRERAEWPRPVRPAVRYTDVMKKLVGGWAALLCAACGTAATTAGPTM